MGSSVLEVMDSFEKSGCSELLDNCAKVSTSVLGISEGSSSSISSLSKSRFPCSHARFLARSVNASMMIFTGVEKGRGMFAWRDVLQLGATCSSIKMFRFHLVSFLCPTLFEDTENHDVKSLIYMSGM